MLPTQAELEDLLAKLRREQAESSLVEAKEDLPLAKPGDKANFIRHIAALANNCERSLLLIGVRNKTWQYVGLPPGSDFLDADSTQGRMNQILLNRLDPNLSVRYATYVVNGVSIGVVAVKGTRAPYITAIGDQSHGGDCTRAEPSYIYRGAIYFRNGPSSEILNRQSDLLRILETSKNADLLRSEPDHFLSANNYLDVESKDFGRHSLTSALIERPRPGYPGQGEEDIPPAQSWVSFIFAPQRGSCTIDTVALKRKLEPPNRIGRGGHWYEGLPEEIIKALFHSTATPRQFLAKDPPWNPEEPERYERFLRICPSGHLEFVATYPLFFPSHRVRCFGFVATVGYLWQLLYLTKAVYQDAGYSGSVRVLLNLIGTKGTILADFATGDRGWASPFDRMHDLENVVWSKDASIQIPQDIRLLEASDESIEKTVRAMAGLLGAYYGQEQPRCFDYNSGEFPYRQYLEEHCRR